MKSRTKSCLIAIVGGSGAGKSWLADQLHRIIGKGVSRLSLDDFYRDRSSLAPTRRDKINFDHPRAIDWPSVEQVLRDCQSGRPAHLPRYDFSTHTRSSHADLWQPTPLIIMDGLWLLHRPAVRRRFDFRIFIDCPARLRLRRRLERDATERGRTPASVRRQFSTTVAPMHQRYVEPQARWADVVLTSPIDGAELHQLADRIARPIMRDWLYRTWMRQPFEAALRTVKEQRCYL
jgi:uridine kinase